MPSLHTLCSDLRVVGVGRGSEPRGGPKRANVKTRPLRVGISPSRQMRHDEPRVARAEDVPREAMLLELVRAHIGDEDVRLVKQAQQRLAVGGDLNAPADRTRDLQFRR